MKENRIPDMGLKDMSVDEIIDALVRLRDSGHGKWKARIVNRHGAKSCIGKIIGVEGGAGEGGVIYLLPAPEDIDAIVSITRIVAMLSCDKAAKGQSCDTCAEVATCKHMKRFDDNWKRIYEGEEK